MNDIWFYYLLLLVIVGLSAEELSDNPKIKTSLGGIRGFYDFSSNGRKYEAYEGIPFAQPPIGDLRFRPPQKIKPWLGDIVATKTGSPCMQFIHHPLDAKEKIIGSEDCLYLNIYKPVLETTKLLPVIMWIHGGGFQWNMDFKNGKYAGPDFLMDRDVIFVTFNYRLGPLGFMSTGDDLISGNMGLKDQSMAISWVKENIKDFGGNPDLITLFGLSAGGVSVHYHYLSSLSKGLFRQGLSFSGTALSPWAITEAAPEKTKKIATIVGCPSSNNDEMIMCLKSRPARHIAKAAMDFMPWFFNPMTPFGPVIEKETAESPFITEAPEKIISTGGVYDAPWITGVVPEEGLYPGADFCGDDILLKELDARWDSLVPHILDYNYTIPLDKQIEVNKKIRKYYIGDSPVDKTTAWSIIHMIGDRFYTAGSVKAVKLMAKSINKPVFYYYFTYKGAESLGPIMMRKNMNFGISHGDDAAYVIKFASINPTTTSNDRMMQRELLDLWVSYVTNGVPDAGINWKSIDPSEEKLTFLHIRGPGQRQLDSDDNFGNIKFWSSIEFDE
ncbi:venom carboxylesterase-6-like [Chelonus insularis]|uniref:venom carboxylesterase-6-like n=1 Tax=Chelonus insularis TaxID=460826 RepID=UPI00158CE1B1|nr:venom carboxylesterase-6-like [Chelonus insularis]